MRIPIWLLDGLAVLVIVFGVYRIRIGFRSDEQDKRARTRKGLYAMSRRKHVLIGIIYVMLGAGLIATALGWNPFGNLFGPTVEPGTTLTAPTSTGIQRVPAPPTAPAAKPATQPSTQPATQP